MARMVEYLEPGGCPNLWERGNIIGPEREIFSQEILPDQKRRLTRT